MIQPVRPKDWKFLGPVLFAVLAFGFLVVLPWPSAMPGSLEEAFAEVRLDMSQDETLAVLEGCNDIDGFWSVSTTKSGQSWNTCTGGLSKHMPPSDEIAHGELSITNKNEDRVIEITFGPGGVVTDKRLVPGVWEYRLDKVGHAVARAGSDIVSVPWWEEQLHKAKRSVRRRWH